MKPILKHPKNRLLPLAIAITALTALSGCGGGDDAPAPAPAPPTAPPPPPPPTVTISGAVGGSLQNAKVCVDVNDNRACDAAEPSTTSSATGTYSLANVLASDATAHPLVAEVSTTTLDADGAAMAGAFTMVTPVGQTIISPYTTLLQSELDSGRAPSLTQASENILSNLVGTAGDVGGLTLYSNYTPDATDTTAQATRRAKMYGLGQLLEKGFAKTKADSALTGKALIAAQGEVAIGSLQQVLSQVPGKLAPAERDTLFAALQDSLVPTAAHLAAVKAAEAKTAAAPIEGAWIRTTVNGAVTTKELYLFGGDGTFVHQTIEPGVPAATSTVFDNGFGYRYGRYTLSNGTLTTSLIEASEAAGPGNGSLTNVTISGNTLTAAGGVTATRVTSASNPLVGGWVRPHGSNEPEFLVMFDDGTYLHSTFYYQNDPQTGTATFFETAKSAGVRKGAYTVDAGNNKLVNFGDTTVLFNGALAIPSNPGVALLQADGSLTMTGLRLVKLGSTDGAKAVTGFSEATRSRLWSGRYFSRTLSIGGSNRLQYVYVRGPNDVLTFLQAPTGSDATVACGSNPAVQGTPLPDFTSVSPADGKLKQFVVGTSTNASAGYAQRRLNVGQPGVGNFVTYTPITRPSNTTARCAVPL